VLLPRVVRDCFVRGPASAAASGIVLYPAAVLGLILCFPSRLDLAAIAG
jgi:hypothetical protein